MAAPYIVEVLTYLFNLCIDNCVFPQCFKFAKVVPVFKKGDKSDYNNYRPVSVLPVFSKVLEVLINSQVLEYFEHNLLFSNNQYGFRPKKSTCQAVVDFVKNCIYSLDVRQKVIGNFYDMSKAFDTISHCVLLEKLKYYGFESKAIDFINSYLSHRFQSVCCNGNFSNFLPVNTGVPQGSILGPTIFIIYVNDLTAAIDKKCSHSYMYADDLAVQISCKDVTILNSLISDCNSIIDDWSAANFLCLNKTKTQSLEFSYKSGISVDDVKFLGVFLQSNVKWNVHIDFICKKVSRSTFLLRKLKCIVSLDVLISVYFAHIQSHLLYCVFVWGSDRYVKKLLILQKRAIRIIAGAYYREHCKPLFRKLGILTVTSLFILECLMFVKLNLDVIPTNSVVHSYHTRFNYHLRITQCNYMSTINSSYELAIRLYNMLPASIKKLDITSFKKQLKCMLLHLSVYTIDEFIDSCNSC